MVRNYINPDENTAKLVITTFHKVSKNRRNGVCAQDITRYLQSQFGKVWHSQTLTDKAEQILKQSALLGFLLQQDERYTTSITRLAQCRGVGRCSRRRRRRRRRRRCCRRKKRRRVCRCCSSKKC